MALPWVVKGCLNSSRKLKKWKETLSEIHYVARENELCQCDPPFT